MLTLSHYENDGLEFDRSNLIADDNRQAGGLERKALESVANWWGAARKPILIGEYGKYKVGSVTTNLLREITSQSYVFYCEFRCISKLQDLLSCWTPSPVDTFERQNKELDHLKAHGPMVGEMNWSCDQYFGLKIHGKQQYSGHRVCNLDCCEIDSCGQAPVERHSSVSQDPCFQCSTGIHGGFQR